MAAQPFPPALGTDFVDASGIEWTSLGLVTDFATSEEFYAENLAAEALPHDAADDGTLTRDQLAEQYRQTIFFNGHVWEMKYPNYMAADLIMSHLVSNTHMTSDPSALVAPLEEIQPITVFGSDGRVLRRDNTSFPMSAHFASLTQSGTACSGTLLSPSTAITAGHCIHTTKRWLAYNRIDFGPDAQDPSPSVLSYSGVPLRQCLLVSVPRNRVRGDGDVKHDYAVLNFGRCNSSGMNPTPGNVVGWFGAGASRNEINGGPNFFVYGSPAGSCPSIGCLWPSIFGVGSNWGGLRQNHEVKYRTDTSGGQSGAGVYIFRPRVANERYVVATHKGGTWDSLHGGSYNHGRRLDDGVFAAMWTLQMMVLPPAPTSSEVDGKTRLTVSMLRDLGGLGWFTLPSPPPVLATPS